MLLSTKILACLVMGFLAWNIKPASSPSNSSFFADLAFFSFCPPSSISSAWIIGVYYISMACSMSSRFPLATTLSSKVIVFLIKPLLTPCHPFASLFTHNLFLFCRFDHFLFLFCRCDIGCIKTLQFLCFHNG